MHAFSHTSATTESSQTARTTLVAGTDLIHTILRTTLGPSGTLKILYNSDKHAEGSKHYMTCTNDGATILSSLVIDSASAQLLIDASVSQDKELGDGTTSVALLAALLVRESYRLDMHSVKVVRGYQIAVEKCIEILDTLILNKSNMGLDESNDESNDTSNDESNDDYLFNLARTTLMSKVVSNSLDHFASIATRAVKNLSSDKDINLINIIKCAGRLEDSFYVDDGFILDKDVEVPSMDDVRVLVANTSLDYDKIKVFGAKVEVQSVGELGAIEEAEKTRMRSKVEKMCYRNSKQNSIKKEDSSNNSNKNESNNSNSKINSFNDNNSKKEDFKNNSNNDNNSNSNNDKNTVRERIFDVFVNRQLIYDLPKQLFKQHGITPIEHADFDGIERLSKVLNASIMSSFYTDIQEESIGRCKRVENVCIGDKRMVKFTGLKPGAGTIVICGSSKDMLDEAERSVHDALCVLRDSQVVCGGGSVEAQLSVGLIEHALNYRGEESEAVLAFARALVEIPKILAENCGFDGEKVKAMLRAEHQAGNVYVGVDVKRQGVCCMKTSKVYESFKVKRRVLMCAAETAQMLIKCDGFVKTKEKERQHA